MIKLQVHSRETDLFSSENYQSDETKNRNSGKELCNMEEKRRQRFEKSRQFRKAMENNADFMNKINLEIKEMLAPEYQIKAAKDFFLKKTYVNSDLPLNELRDSADGNKDLLYAHDEWNESLQKIYDDIITDCKIHGTV